MSIALKDIVAGASDPVQFGGVLQELKNMDTDECPVGMDNLFSDMKLELMPYQKTDALFHVLVKKSFNLSDPGLGKTAISIGYITLLERMWGRPVKAIAVTPSATVYQWSDEFKKFNPGIKPFVVEGGPEKRRKIYTAYADYDGSAVLIFNYEKIRNDFGDISACSMVSDTVILDEVTCLKDRNAKTHGLFKELCSGMERSLLLTATPISTNLEEFYALLEIIGMGDVIAPSYEVFAEHFLVTRSMNVKGKWGGKFEIKKACGSKNVELFEEKMHDLYIRHENDASAFANLNLEIIKQPVRVTFTQARLIEKAAREFREAGDDANPLQAYQDFSKICMDPSIYDENCPSFSPKIEKLVDFLKNNKNEKYVVYARFLSFHRLVHKRLIEEGITFVSLTGAENAKQKEEAKTAFTEKSVSDVQVILLTDAGKFGLNLQNAHNIILMDIPYTPSNALQIIGRVFRTGQTKDVTAVFIYCEDTLEENQFHRLEERQQSVDSFFSTNKADLFALKSDDMFQGRKMRKRLSQMEHIKGPYTPEPDVLMAEDFGY